MFSSWESDRKRPKTRNRKPSVTALHRRAQRSNPSDHQGGAYRHAGCSVKEGKGRGKREGEEAERLAGF